MWYFAAIQHNSGERTMECINYLWLLFWIFLSTQLPARETAPAGSEAVVGSPLCLHCFLPHRGMFQHLKASRGALKRLLFLGCVGTCIPGGSRSLPWQLACVFEMFGAQKIFSFNMHAAVGVETDLRQWAGWPWGRPPDNGPSPRAPLSASGGHSSSRLYCLIWTHIHAHYLFPQDVSL